MWATGPEIGCASSSREPTTSSSRCLQGSSDHGSTRTGCVKSSVGSPNPAVAGRSCPEGARMFASAMRWRIGPTLFGWVGMRGCGIIRTLRTSCPLHDPVFDVRHRGRGDHLDRLQNRIAYVLEQPLTSPKNDGHDVQVQLVQATGGEILPDRARTAGDRHVLITGAGAGSLKRR